MNWQGYEQQQQTTKEMPQNYNYWPETNFVSTMRAPYNNQPDVLTTPETHIPTTNVNVDSSVQMPVNEPNTVTVSAPQNQQFPVSALTDAQVLHFIDNKGNVPTSIDFLHSLYLFVESRLINLAHRNGLVNASIEESTDYYFHLIISGDYELLRTLLQ